MQNKEYTESLIIALRNEPSIWKIKSDIYRDKVIKAKAWENLVEVAVKFDPKADVEVVKRKVNILRTSYRRELQKVRKSEKSGAGTEDLYVPTLWFYESLEFLKDQECQAEGVSTLCDNQETQKAKPQKRKKINEDELLEKAMQHIENASTKLDDDAAIYSEAWERQFRKLNEHQQFYAKRLIDDVLHYGQLQCLDITSSVYFRQLQNVNGPQMMPVTANNGQQQLYRPYANLSSQTLGSSGEIDILEVDTP